MIWLLLAMAPAGDEAATLLATSRALIAGERCRPDPNTTDITVCGRRRADRFRVPFVVHDAGDPRYEAVAVERDRLLHRTNPVQDLSPFLVGGGMAGVTMSSRTGLTGTTTDRSLAP
ncbi:hypothetical protein M9979_10275 [Sphingomonas sp. RP10(2022)]|uniref:Uncharacterized protein n=1 Tax=Sphingomonas liriopis TaxID=2949094 RepID=A0A9X2I003_9SPHN|nr:hypothetical protein [Sphingomonas liriopis]MCP3735255.1 hypothetical protein [Sphingomonas liriopis]